MSEFFKKKNPPNNWDETAAFRERWQNIRREIVKKQAAELLEPLEYLHQELVSQKIKPNTRIVEEVGPKRTRQRVGMGWLLSEAKTSQGEHSITMMKDGKLVLGSAVAGRNKDRNGVVIPGIVTAVHEGEIDLDIDLDDYQPPHPSFETERGYAETEGIRSQAILDHQIPQTPRPGEPQHSVVPRNTCEGHVLVNLERLEHDARNSGRELLGIT